MTQIYHPCNDRGPFECHGCGAAVFNMTQHDKAHERWDHPVHVIESSQITAEPLAGTPPLITYRDRIEVIKRLLNLAESGALNTQATKSIELIINDLSAPRDANTSKFTVTVLNALYPNGVQ